MPGMQVAPCEGRTSAALAHLRPFAAFAPLSPRSLCFRSASSSHTVSLLRRPFPSSPSTSRRVCRALASPKSSAPDTSNEAPLPELKSPNSVPNSTQPPPTSSKSASAARDDRTAYSIGETPAVSPQLNSTLMNAMRDYFGDDGREVQDYMKRPRNKNGEPMFRVVVVGSGPRELQAIEKLHASDVITGLYYCPDEDGVCDIQMSKFGQSATVSAYFSTDVVRFSSWIVADAVFVGPDRAGCISKEAEAALAEGGITVFPHDVTAAIAEGGLQALECLSPLADENEEGPAEQLLE